MATIPEGPVAVIRDLNHTGLSVTVHDNSDANSRFQATLSCIPKYDYEPQSQIHTPITSYINKDKSFQPDQITYPKQTYDNVEQTNFCNVYQGFNKENINEEDSDFKKPVVHLLNDAIDNSHLYRDYQTQFKGSYDYYCDGNGFERNVGMKDGSSMSPNRSLSPNRLVSPNRSISPNRTSSPIGMRSIGINSRLQADRGPRSRQNELSSFTFQDKYGTLVTRPLCSEFPPQRNVPDKVRGNFATTFSTGSNNHSFPVHQRNVALERSGVAVIENSNFANSLRKYPDRGKCLCPDSYRDIAERLSTYVRTKKVNKSSCHPVKRGHKKLKEKLFGGCVGKATKVTQTYARKYNIQAAMSRQIVLNSVESELIIQEEEEFSDQYDYLKGGSKNSLPMSQRHAQDLEVRYLLDLLKCIKKRMRSICQPNSQSSNSAIKSRFERHKKMFPKSNIAYPNMDSSTTNRAEGSSESMNQDTIQAMPALYTEKSDPEKEDPGSSKTVKWGCTSRSLDTFTRVCPGCKHAHKQLQEQIEAEVKDWSKMLPIQPQEPKEYEAPTTVTDNMTRELINTLTCLKIRFKNNDFNVYAKKEISSFISNLPAKLPNDEEKRTKLFETLSNKLVDKLSQMDTTSEKTKEQEKVAKANDDKESSIIDLEGLARKIVSRLMELDFKYIKELKKSKSSLENKISDIISDLPLKLSFRDKNKVFKNSLELFSECINSFYPKHDKSVLESVTDEHKKDLDTYFNKSNYNHGVSIKDNTDESIYKVNYVNTDSKLKENPLAEAECDNKVFIESFTRPIGNDIIDLIDKNATNTADSISANHTNTRPATKIPVTDDIMLRDSNNDKSSANLKLNEVPNEKSQEISDQILDKFKKLSSVKVKKSSNDSVNIKDEPTLQSRTQINGSDKEKCSTSLSSLGLTKSTSLKIEHFQKNLIDKVECLLKKYTKSDQIAKVNSGNSITNDFISKVKEICVGLDNENRQLKELRLRDEIARYMNNVSLKSDTSKETLVAQLLKSLEKNATSKDKKSNGEGSKTSITTTELYREICAAIKHWIIDLQIHMNKEQKETVMQEMAKELYDDITLRRKYKQIYENDCPKVKEDDVCLKYNVYKLVNKIFDLNDLTKIIPKIPDLVDKLQDIEGGYVSSKEIESDASTSRDINELVEKLCDQLFCSLNPSHNQLEIEKMKRNLTNKTIHKLKSLHDDLEIINDDLLYSSALNEELDNILGSLWTSHGTDRSKDQFKCKLADILSGYKSKKCDERGENCVSYKQQLRNAIENVILLQDGIRIFRNKENYATIELFKESLVDAYLNMVFNTDKRKSETKAKFAKDIKQLVSYIKEITGRTNIDYDKLTIDLELALARVPRPNSDVIIIELNKLRYKEALSEWLNTLTLTNDSEEDKLERLQQITLLVKRICDLSKQKSSLQEETYLKRIKSAVSVFWKKLRKDSNLTSQTNELVDQLYEQIYNLIDNRLGDIELPQPIQSPLQSTLSEEERALLQTIRDRAKNSKNYNFNSNDYPIKDDIQLDYNEGPTAGANPPHNDLKAPHLVVREYYIDPKSPNSPNLNANPPSIPTFISTVPCCGSGLKSSACFSGTGLPPHIPPIQRQAREIHQPYRRPNYVDINVPGRLTTRYNYKTNDDNDKTETSLEVNLGDREYADDYTEITNRNQNRRNYNPNQRTMLDESGSSDHIYGKDISNIGGNLRPEKARGRFKKMMENSNARYEKDCHWCPGANYYKNCPKCYDMECPYPSKLYFNHD